MQHRSLSCASNLA